MKLLNSLLLHLILLASTSTLLGCSKNNDEPTIIVDKNDNTYSPLAVRTVLEAQQKNAFTYFYEFAEPNSGLSREGYLHGDGDVITTGGSGFGIMALIVGADRNWITRNDAAGRVQKAVRFLGKASRFKGAWSHWIRPDGTAYPFGPQVEAGDLVESSFMLQGLIAAQEYFNMNTSVEKEIRDSVTSFINTIQWNGYTNNTNSLYWVWHSPSDKYELAVHGWNEALATYLLGLAAPDKNKITINHFKSGWEEDGRIYNSSRTNYGYKLPLGWDFGGPLFFSHYSFLGFNPKRMKDKYAFYWTNNSSHVMINRHYCVYEAPKNFLYSERMWGLTACNGVDELPYKERRPGNSDDGVIAPTAALASYPYTPFYSTQVLLEMDKISALQGKYGLGDSYRPSTGRSNNKHLAIDQGPIVVMIENYRSGLIWDLVMRSSYIQKCLQVAGIELDPVLDEGFSYSVINSQTKVLDLMMHPDREKYEIDFYSSANQELELTLVDDRGAVVKSVKITCKAGSNLLSFTDEGVLKGRNYTLKAKTSKVYELNVCLR